MCKWCAWQGVYSLKFCVSFVLTCDWFAVDVRCLGEARRQLATFKPDPSVASMFSASNDDYQKSGWSRGHMAPAGNYKHDQVERSSSA